MHPDSPGRLPKANVPGSLEALLSRAGFVAAGAGVANKKNSATAASFCKKQGGAVAPPHSILQGRKFVPPLAYATVTSLLK